MNLHELLCAFSFTTLLLSSSFQSSLPPSLLALLSLSVLPYSPTSSLSLATSLAQVLHAQ